jgi:citrate synthase
MEVVPDTAISDVDGQNNRITIRGKPLEELAGRLTYEEMCGFLWSGEAVAISLGESRVRAASQLPRGGGLRAALASLQDEDPRQLTAAVAIAVARDANPNAPDPDPAAGHAADFLRMATGTSDPVRASALETYLVALAENGLNTSTYVARIVASTGAASGPSILAAYCALEGPRHGGAPGDVLEMFESAGDASRARAWVESELSASRRLPGMGHRIFTGRDPRAAILESALGRLPATPRLEVVRALEQAAVGGLAARGKTLKANVEFYTAALLDAIGLPKALFTPTFAVARVAGWCAHIAEQRTTGKLIQPNARYVGPKSS